MPQVDLIDETFVVAGPDEVAAAVHDADSWRRWWPDLRLTVFQDRGTKGVRWSISGALVGSMEVWLEPYGDGVIVHYYLRADPTPPGHPTGVATVHWRRALKEIQRRQRMTKRVFWSMKDVLEGSRKAAEPAPTPGG